MLVKSNSPNGSSKDLSTQLAAEAKINEALSRAISVMTDLISEQKELSADTQISHQEISSKIDSLVSALNKWYGREEKEVEKDTSVADAIKNIKFPQTKIDFEPFTRLAASIEKQNTIIAEMASKFQQAGRNDNHSYEPFMRELMSVISNNSNAISLLKPPIPKDDTILISTIAKAVEGNKVKEWEFTVQYNPNDSISKITAKPKV